MRWLQFALPLMRGDDLAGAVSMASSPSKQSTSEVSELTTVLQLQHGSA